MSFSIITSTIFFLPDCTFAVSVKCYPDIFIPINSVSKLAYPISFRFKIWRHMLSESIKGLFLVNDVFVTFVFET